MLSVTLEGKWEPKQSRWSLQYKSKRTRIASRKRTLNWSTIQRHVIKNKSRIKEQVYSSKDPRKSSNPLFTFYLRSQVSESWFSLALCLAVSCQTRITWLDLKLHCITRWELTRECPSLSHVRISLWFSFFLSFLFVHVCSVPTCIALILPTTEQVRHEDNICRNDSRERDTQVKQDTWEKERWSPPVECTSCHVRLPWRREFS